MEDATYTFPEHLRVMGDEAQRLHQRVMDELEAGPLFEPTSDEPLLTLAPALMQRMSVHLERFDDVLNGPLNDAAGGDDVAAIYRAMGRMEQLLDQWFAILHEAQSIVASPSESYPKGLLCDAISDVVKQIGAFFGHVAEVIDDPEPFVSPDDISSDNTIVLPLNLVLDAPPELHELGDYWRLIAPTEGPSAPQRSGGINLLTLAVGALLASSLFSGCD